MSTTTDVLSLFKYDPVADADSTFNITQAINNNWDKLDAAILLAIAAAGAYNPEESYAVGDYCTYKGKLRKCSTAIPTGEAWTEAHWTTTTVAAEMQELSSQLSNKLSLSGGQMTGLIGFGNNKGIGTADIATSLDIFAGQIGIRLIPTNAVGNNISKCAKLRDGNSGSMYDIATATPPQEFDLPLAEGVSAVSSAYWKDQFGVVTGHFNVLVSSSQTGSSPVIATLPEGFRPSRQANATAVVSSGESLGLLVLVTGEIQLQDAASVTLEGKYIKGLFSFVAAT